MGVARTLSQEKYINSSQPIPLRALNRVNIRKKTSQDVCFLCPPRLRIDPTNWIVTRVRQNTLH
jgi:hypothetical protein